VSGSTADAVFAGCTRRVITPALDAPVPRAEHPGLDAAEGRGYFEAAGLADYFERLGGG